MLPVARAYLEITTFCRIQLITRLIKPWLSHFRPAHAATDCKPRISHRSLLSTTRLYSLSIRDALLVAARPLDIRYDRLHRLRQTQQTTVHIVHALVPPVGGAPPNLRLERVVLRARVRARASVRSPRCCARAECGEAYRLGARLQLLRAVRGRQCLDLFRMLVSRFPYCAMQHKAAATRRQETGHA